MLAFVMVFYEGMVCFCRMTSLFFLQDVSFCKHCRCNFFSTGFVVMVLQGPFEAQSWLPLFPIFTTQIIFSSSLYHFGLPGVNHWKIHDLGCKFVNNIKVVYLSVFQMIMIAYCT